MFLENESYKTNPIGRECVAVSPKVTSDSLGLQRAKCCVRRAFSVYSAFVS